MRYSKHITDKKDIDYLLNLKQDDITSTFIMETFGKFNKNKKFNPYDTFIVPKGAYHNNKNDCTTTIGLWIFNIYFIDQELFDLFGYINYTLTKKTMGKINSKLSCALIEDDITLDQLKHFLMKTQKFMPYVSILSPSQTLKMLICTKDIDKKKKELSKKYEKELKEGDVITAEKMQNELKDYARELLKGDPSMDSYDSGARGSFDNNFKNMFIMKGAMQDPDPNKGFNIATSNYMTGVAKEEYSMFANSLAAGPYRRGKKTELGGYWEKLFVSAFQHIKLGPANSDCGSTHYLEVFLTEQNLTDYIYSYVLDGTRLVEITSKNADKYLNKKIKIRFSLFCKAKNYKCNKCVGNLFYRLGIQNVGIATATIPSTLKNLSMKSFHDSQINTIEIDPAKVFGVK